MFTDFDDIIDKLSILNEEADKDFPTFEELLKEANEEASTEETSEENITKEVKEAIKPQVEIATSTINAIKEAFSDNCNNTKELELMVKQITSWEKTIRGACQSIVEIVNNKKLFKTDESGNWVKNEEGKILAWNDKPIAKVFSPKAYGWIKDVGNRDRSTLDWCAAIIIFYNSLS